MLFKVIFPCFETEFSGRGNYFDLTILSFILLADLSSFGISDSNCDGKKKERENRRVLEKQK